MLSIKVFAKLDLNLMPFYFVISKSKPTIFYVKVLLWPYLFYKTLFFNSITIKRAFNDAFSRYVCRFKHKLSLTSRDFTTTSQIIAKFSKFYLDQNIEVMLKFS